MISLSTEILFSEIHHDRSSGKSKDIKAMFSKLAANIMPYDEILKVFSLKSNEDFLSLSLFLSNYAPEVLAR